MKILWKIHRAIGLILLPIFIGILIECMNFLLILSIFSKKPKKWLNSFFEPEE